MHEDQSIQGGGRTVLALAQHYAESDLVESARERTEERFLATVADAAETEAIAHETAAAVSRQQAEVAQRALRARTGRTGKTASKKKK